MDRKNQWRIWQLINEVGLRSEEERKLLRDGCEEFPAQIIGQQIENLEKLGFNDAAGMDIKKITPHPSLNCGISKAYLPAYLVIPEQVVPLAKQCEMLKVDCRLEFLNITNEYPSVYPERPYWIFQTEIHGAGRIHKNCEIEDLDKVDRCGLTIVEGLAVLREKEGMRSIITECKRKIALPGSRHGVNNENIPWFRLPYKNIESISEEKEIGLDSFMVSEIIEEMKEYPGISEMSETMIISRAKRTFQDGACREKHPNR